MTIDKATSICTHYNITMHEFALLYYIGVKKYTNIEHYITECGNYSVESIKKLEEKGLVELFSDNLTLENIKVSQTFLSKIIVDIEYASEELRDVYPSVIIVNDQVHNAKNLRGRKLEELYSKVIKGDLELHKKIIKVTTKWANMQRKYNGRAVAPLGLQRFLEDGFYETLLEMKDGDSDADSTFDYI